MCRRLTENFDEVTITHISFLMQIVKMAACDVLKNLRGEEMFRFKGKVWRRRECNQEGVRTVLRTHVLNKHLAPDQVPWKCGGCSSRFMKEKQLKRHQRSKHPKGAKVVCSVEDFAWGSFLQKRTAAYSKNYYRRFLISPPPQEAPVLVKVEPVEDDDLGPMPETALEEPEVEEEVEPEEQEVAEYLGPVPEAALEEPEMEDEAEEGHKEQRAADDLGPVPEAALEEPEMEDEVDEGHEEQKAADDLGPVPEAVLEEPEMEDEAEEGHKEQRAADDLGPVPEAALEEPEMEDEADEGHEEQKAADDLGPVPEAVLEEPEMGKVEDKPEEVDLCPMPQITLLEPNMQGSAVAPSIEQPNVESPADSPVIEGPPRTQLYIVDIFTKENCL